MKMIVAPLLIVITFLFYFYILSHFKLNSVDSVKRNMRARMRSANFRDRYTGTVHYAGMYTFIQ